MPKKVGSSFRISAYFVAFIIICLVVNWADKTMVDTRNVTIGSMKMTSQKQKQRTVADVILSTLKILLGFYQVLNGTVNSFPNIPWPNSLTEALRVFKFIEFEILRIPSSRCIKPE